MTTDSPEFYLCEGFFPLMRKPSKADWSLVQIALTPEKTHITNLLHCFYCESHDLSFGESINMDPKRCVVIHNTSNKPFIAIYPAICIVGVVKIGL
jgi:hypothetical protein